MGTTHTAAHRHQLGPEMYGTFLPLENEYTFLGSLMPPKDKRHAPRKENNACIGCDNCLMLPVDSEMHCSLQWSM